MQQIILKKDIEKNKIEALLFFLKSWDIEVEFKNSVEVNTKKKSDFSLSAGIWEDYKLDGSELRKQAWSRNL